MLALLMLAAVIWWVVPLARVKALACTPTGFNATTAAMVNPVGVVNGTIDATGCTFGIFYDASHNGTVLSAILFGASEDGIVSQGGTLSVRDSAISNVGEQAITVSGSTTITISNNTISHYGANTAGIQATLSSAPSSSAVITRNKVSASAANDVGMNIVGGTSLTVTGNMLAGTTSGILLSAAGSTSLTVSDNMITGNALGSGIVAIGPATVKSNTLTENLFGISVVDTTTTPIHILRNVVHTGQIGIDAVGNSGQVIGNSICVAPGGQPLTTSGGGLLVSGNATDTSCP
jgi:hypothetical protein